LHRLDIGEGLADIGLGDLVLLLGVAVDRLLIGRASLINATLRFVQGVSRLVEPRHRSVTVLSQLADAVVGLLRQHDSGLRPLERGLFCGNDLGAGTDIDVGELRLGHDLRRQHLLVLGDGLGIVDAHQHRAGGHILAALDRHLRDPSVDTRRDIESRRIHLTLHEQRLWPNQYQIDNAATAAITTPTMMDGMRVREGACGCLVGSIGSSLGRSFGGSLVSPGSSGAARA
jgi:hypothetical protein